jgi:probable rRNA maturation factor
MAEKINFFNEESSFTIKHKGLIRQWIKACIISENLKTGNINIVFCSDNYLHEINIKYLNHDTLTDIITFNYSEGKTISGDLFISIERVLENSNYFSNNSLDELHRVIIHGILHLCNYEDKSVEAKKIMTEKENINLARRPDQLRVQ